MCVNYNMYSPRKGYFKTILLWDVVMFDMCSLPYLDVKGEKRSKRELQSRTVFWKCSWTYNTVHSLWGLLIRTYSDNLPIWLFTKLVCHLTSVSLLQTRFSLYHILLFIFFESVYKNILMLPQKYINYIQFLHHLFETASYIF